MPEETPSADLLPLDVILGRHDNVKCGSPIVTLRG